jgi:putative ribosome biogenesis GTPase RsgA
MTNSEIFTNLTQASALALLRSSIKDVKLILLSLSQTNPDINKDYLQRVLLSVYALNTNIEDLISIAFQPHE